MPRASLSDIVETPRSASVSDIAVEAPPAPAGPAPAEPSLVDRAVGLLPTAGGIAGGIVGGIGGTVGGFGVGGVPGAIGGATLGGGFGEAAKQLINRMRGDDAPASRGAAAKDIALQGGIQGGAEALGAGVAKVATAGAKAVYRGYLKPSLAAKNIPKAKEVVDTALREAIPITRSGAGVEAGGKITGKAGRIITEMRQEVDRLLAKTTGKVDLKEIADRVRAFAKRKYFKPGGDPSDYQAALSVADRLDRHPSLGLSPNVRPTRIPVTAAQGNEVKRALQSGASSSFGVPNAAAKVDAEKMASHYTRKAVERVAGGPTGQVAKLNARESKLLDAAKAIAQAVEREANQSKLYGVKTLAAGAYGGTGYAQGDDPLTAVGKFALARGALQPGVQSGLAIVANQIAKQLGVSVATATRLAAHVLLRSEEPED